MPPKAVDAEGEVQIAYETPSIACGDWSDMSCIIVWAGAAERGTVTADPHLHTLRWMQLEADVFGGFTFGDVVTEPYLLHGPPRVSFLGDGVPGDFVLAYPLEYGELEVWTARKGRNETDSWRDFVSHFPGWRRHGFDMGSSNGYAELVANGY